MKTATKTWVVIRWRPDKRTIRGWWIVDATTFSSQEAAEAHVKAMRAGGTNRRDQFDIHESPFDV